MANISVGGTGSKRKSVDSELPLVPFIDLLLCCVMFLLVTAVWNEISVMNAQQPAQGAPDAMVSDVSPRGLLVAIRMDAFEIGMVGGAQERIARTTDDATYVSVDEALRKYRKLDASLVEATIVADDGIAYADLVRTMDTVKGAGLKSLRVGD